MSNGFDPATKQDIAELKAEFKQDIAELRAELKQDGAMIRSEMQHMHDDMKETMRDIQTELLKAFYSFAESDQARLTQTERDSSGLKERIGILERRLTEVERKVNFPDHPTQ
jgi:hypothetical protein